MTHCPTCGRDFALEHRNDTLGEHMALCLPCLVDTLIATGVDTTRFAFVDRRGATKAQWVANHAEAAAREAGATQVAVTATEAAADRGRFAYGGSPILPGLGPNDLSGLLSAQQQMYAPFAGGGLYGGVGGRGRAEVSDHEHKARASAPQGSG